MAGRLMKLDISNTVLYSCPWVRFLLIYCCSNNITDKPSYLNSFLCEQIHSYHWQSRIIIFFLNSLYSSGYFIFWEFIFIFHFWDLFWFSIITYLISMILIFFEILNWRPLKLQEYFLLCRGKFSCHSGGSWGGGCLVSDE
jgi:hypothetical protein